MKTRLLLKKRWNFGVGTEDDILVKEVSTSTTGLRFKALAAGEYVVDWGDGTVETRTIDSGTVGQYYYNTHTEHSFHNSARRQRDVHGKIQFV